MRLYLVFPLALAACDTGHLPNPLTLPYHAVASGVENATYQARRDRVSAYLRDNRTAVFANGAPGPAWDGLKTLARTKPENEAQMIRDFQRIDALPQTEWVEQATVIAMVLGV